MSRSFYVSQEVRLVIPKPRLEQIRLTLGTRSNGEVYVDLRNWYMNNQGIMSPGKGIATADVNGVWDQIADQIARREERQEETVVYNPVNLPIANIK